MKIFLIIFDTLRKDHTGKIYENNWISTPNFDKFAKDSIVFYKAYPESLPTIPVRRAIHTGIRTFPFNHKRPKLRTDDIAKVPGWHPIPPNQIHLSEFMTNFNFVTSFISSTYHQFKPNMNFHLGFDQWNWIRGQEGDNFRARIKDEESLIGPKVDEYSFGNRKARISKRMHKYFLERYFRNTFDRKTEQDYFAGKTFTKAIEFVNDTINVKNTFSVIDEFDPHEPWDPPNKYLNLYLDKDYLGHKVIMSAYSNDIKFITKEELKYMRAAYAGEVSMCDNWFGRFIEELKNLEIYEDSLIILISDHGHSLGEHNAIGKLPMYLYPELVDIPFMIKPPGNLNGPKKIQKPYIYNFDILPTIFGFLNKEKPDIFDGIDLSLFLEGEDQFIENRDYITCGFHECTLYKDDQYALITFNNRSTQKLFNLSKDPEWNNNISMDNPDICNELYEKIEKDAKGELLLNQKVLREELMDWYYHEGLKILKKKT